MGKLERGLTSSQMIVLGFTVIILLGCILLMLPLATVSGEGASFSDALFTSTSAVCVTGLIVHDTASYWSGFGQAVILILVQTGGMGVITAVLGFTMLAGKRIGLKQRSTLQEVLYAPKLEGIVRLMGTTIKTTLAIEISGALLMFPVFYRELGMAKGLWYSIFHSVSAFCNAGFDLMGYKKSYSSLTCFVSSGLINFVIMVLIVAGGIGFMTWNDIRTHKMQISRYRMQSKLILVTTAVLIILPALWFFFFEFGGRPLRERLYSSLFQAVTARTAGFNTVDLSVISESGILMMLILMLIGGSPGSTAGGMKTTTCGVMFAGTLSIVRRYDYVNIFGRRVGEEVLRNVITIVALYLVLFISGGAAISRIEELPLLSCLYETASAIGTAGLSLGITAGLSTVSRAILIFLMFFGRTGALTLVFAASSETQGFISRFPQEKIFIG